MLTIKTIENKFSSNESNYYCFRSSNSQSLTTSELADEMVNYNSTFTKADVEGVLSVLNTVVKKYLSKGYSVKLPFCSIRLSARGTCQNIQDSFIPGTGNNQISYNISVPDSVKKEIEASLEYKQVTPEFTGNASIYNIFALQQNATESTDLNLSAGDVVRIRGKNINFDFEDSKQGVVLYNETDEYQITKFIRLGSAIIDFMLPSDLPAGQYQVELTTKPGVNHYSTASCENLITIQ